MRAAVLLGIAACKVNFDPHAIDAAAPDGPAALVSRDVVARYFLDDSDGATAISDAIVPPTDLAVSYVGGAPTWQALPTGRGIHFATAEIDAGACAPVTGKVRSAFDGTTTATIEVVVDASAGSQYGSRLAHIGANEVWSMSLGYSSDAPEPLVWFSASTSTMPAGDEYRRFAIDLAGRGRTVLTLVFDTSASARSGRARLFADGIELPIFTPETNDTYDAGETIGIPSDASICVGNRPIGGRTPLGSIYYAAFYNVALAEDEIQANVDRLRAWDDH